MLERKGKTKNEDRPVLGCVRSAVCGQRLSVYLMDVCPPVFLFVVLMTV